MSSNNISLLSASDVEEYMSPSLPSSASRVYESVLPYSLTDDMELEMEVARHRMMTRIPGSISSSLSTLQVSSMSSEVDLAEPIKHGLMGTSSEREVVITKKGIMRYDTDSTIMTIDTARYGRLSPETSVSSDGDISDLDLSVGKEGDVESGAQGNVYGFMLRGERSLQQRLREYFDNQIGDESCDEGTFEIGIDEAITGPLLNNKLAVQARKTRDDEVKDTRTDDEIEESQRVHGEMPDRRHNIQEERRRKDKAIVRKNLIDPLAWTEGE